MADDLVRALGQGYEALPRRWLYACHGDAHVAKAEWKRCLAWREANDVDATLQRRQKHFFAVKRALPHYWLGRNDEGDLVTLEKMLDSRKTVATLRAAGVTPARFAAHHVFVTEFWVQNKLAHSGRLIRVIDVKGTSFKDQVTTVRQFFEPTTKAMAHYPDLAKVVLFLNASAFFRFAWKVMSSLFLSGHMRRSIVIMDDGDSLCDWVPSRIVPVEYGGRYEGGLAHCPLEDKLRSYVADLNGASGDDALVGDEGDATDGVHLLEGRWVATKRSESMDPILILQNVGWTQRKLAAFILLHQDISFARDGDEDGSETVHIKSKAGPVHTEVTAVVNSSEPGAGSTIGDKHLAVSASEVLAATVRAPSHLEGITIGTVLRLNYTLPNGDIRVVWHGISRADGDQKICCVQYTRKTDGKAARVLIFSNRKQ